MTGQPEEETPQSPEVQPQYVREELDQELVTHVGEYRQPEADAQPGGGMHLGAVDTEVVPIVPPMSGPADLLGERNQNAQGNEDGSTEIGEELIDPRDEITPG
jgi:hypothetical protein